MDTGILNRFSDKTLCVPRQNKRRVLRGIPVKSACEMCHALEIQAIKSKIRRQRCRSCAARLSDGLQLVSLSHDKSGCENKLTPTHSRRLTHSLPNTSPLGWLSKSTLSNITIHHFFISLTVSDSTLEPATLVQPVARRNSCQTKERLANAERDTAQRSEGSRIQTDASKRLIP